jgi:hypothetical protein
VDWGYQYIDQYVEFLSDDLSPGLQASSPGFSFAVKLAEVFCGKIPYWLTGTERKKVAAGMFSTIFIWRSTGSVS